MIRRAAAALAALLAGLGAPPGAAAGTEEELRAAYLAFAADQNARDAARIRTHLVAGDGLLWVSDGKSFWGADAILARMSSFQKAPVWRVEPEIDRARIVGIDAGTALMHLPLTLVIGRAEAPARLRFLVSLLWVRQAEGWKLAALLTTEEKP